MSLTFKDKQPGNDQSFFRINKNFSPKLKVFGYPYLFRSKEHRYKVCDSNLGKELLMVGKQYWLKSLTYFDDGSRSFHTLKL
jgi:TRAP-type C4-dicarboxylate transport system substrate-binding protein